MLQDSQILSNLGLHLLDLGHLGSCEYTKVQGLRQSSFGSFDPQHIFALAGRLNHDNPVRCLVHHLDLLLLSRLLSSLRGVASSLLLEQSLCVLLGGFCILSPARGWPLTPLGNDRVWLVGAQVVWVVGLVTSPYVVHFDLLSHATFSLLTNSCGLGCLQLPKLNFFGQKIDYFTVVAWSLTWVEGWLALFGIDHDDVSLLGLIGDTIH